MRRTLLFAAALGLVVLGLNLPSGVGAQSEGGPPRRIEVTKVVDGEGPTGGYVIQVDCSTDSGPTSFTLTFDAAGPGVDETQTVFPADAVGSCTIVEIEDQGADSVIYQCVDGAPDQVCIDDQTVDINPVNNISSSAFVVTNVFDADVEPPVDPPVDPPSGDGGVVTATPTYTG